MMFDLDKVTKCVVLLAMMTLWSFGMAANQRVQQLYKINCASCHGAKLTGGNAGSLVDGQWSFTASDEAILEAIRHGQPDKGMPAFDNLRDKDLRALVVLIREGEHRAQTRQRRKSGARQQISVASEPVELATQHHKLILSNVIDHGLTLPWSVEDLGNGRLLVSERGGPIKLATRDDHSGNGEDGYRVSDPISGTPSVWARGQGGMLDIALHPQFESNGWIYLSYSEAFSQGSMTSVVRGRIEEINEGNKQAKWPRWLKWTDQQTICSFGNEHAVNTGFHFGTRIVLQDGYCYFAIGDRGEPSAAQDISVPNGSIFRIHDDGRIPDENQFFANDQALLQVYSYGHRNPQGLVWHPSYNKLFSTEHGPRGGDELNDIVAGNNYGWPLVSHGINYNGTALTDQTSRPGLRDPIKQWTPSPAFCGLAVADTTHFPQWHHDGHADLLLGGLRSETLRRVRIAPQGDTFIVIEEEIVLQGIGRVRDVVSASDGSLLVVLNGPDQIIRISVNE